jgi:serine/threonine protein kinase
MPTLRHCIKCGEHIVAGDRFCAHCGTEQPSTSGAGISEEGPSRWDDIEKRLQAATEGRYHIRGLIGRGGMAAVYLADWPNMELRIAIKVMDPYLLDNETFVQRFLQEARTIAKLRHRHIIRVYDSGQAGELFYFCMDYYPGRSMEQVLDAEGPIPIPAVKLWLHQAGDALGYAHRRAMPVVHRDVKPSNMLLDSEGDVVLTDFGIAKVRDVDQTLRSPSLTMPGAVLGTPAYLSPEQAALILNSNDAPKGGQATGASDQYSLGVVGYEMLCGEAPFSGALAPLCVAHTEKDPPDILEKRPDCPPELAQIVLRMLEKRPTNRWPNMEALCAALAVPTPLAGSSLRTQLVGLARGHNPVGSISLTPLSGEFFVGQSFRLYGTPLDLGGRPLPDRSLSWRSSDPDIAQVTNEGVVKALRPGLVSITAAAEGVSGELRLAVSPNRVDTVVVLPSQLTIPVGGEQTLRTLLLSQEGAELSEREISWTSNDPDVASVEKSGRVVARNKGTTEITVSSEGRSSQATVTVIPVLVASVEVSPRTVTVGVGETGAVTCFPRDSRGNALEDRTVKWTVDCPSIVEISHDGSLRGVAPGRAIVSATIDGVVGTATVTISPERATAIELSPDAGELVEGGTLQLSAVPLSAKGKKLSGRPIRWATSNPEIAEVNGAGTVSGGTSGVARITATCDDAVASAEVIVNSASVAGLDLFPASLSLTAGELERLSVTPRGAEGQALSGRQVSWSSSNPAVAAVTAQGWIRAVDVGEAVITAECEGQSGSAEISVSAVPVAEIEFSQDTVSLEVGEAQTVKAVLRSKSGTPVEDRETSWESTAPDVVQVDSNGRLTALAEGEAEILVASEGLTQRVRVTVVPLRVVSMEISPASIELNEKESAQVVVSLMAREGQPVRGRTVGWSSDHSSVAEVDQKGEVLGLFPGTTTIRAECDDASASVEVTVVPEPVAIVRIQSGEVELAAGEATILSSEVRSESGQELGGRPVVWSSSDPAVVEVSPEGKVSARASGSAIITIACEGHTASVSLSVVPESVESLVLQSPKTTLEVGETTEVGCRVLGTSGRDLTDRTVTWTSTAVAMAEVDARGTVTAIAPGELSIAACCEGREISLNLTVAPPALASVEIAPEGVSILPGESIKLELTLTDVHGQTVRTRPVSWASSEERIVLVGEDGRLTGVASGKATVAVTCEGISTQVPVEVSPVPVRSIEIKAKKSHLKARKADQAVVVVWGQNGRELEDRAVQWESSDPAIAEIGSSGRVRGLKPGTAKITARCDDASDSYLLTIQAAAGLPAWAPWGLVGLAAVVVVALGLGQLMGTSGSESAESTVIPVVASLALAPGDSISLDVGRTLRLGITAQDNAGNPIPEEAIPRLRWEVSDNTVFSVSQAGLLRGLGPGVAQITASLIPSDGATPIEVSGTVVVIGEAVAQVAQLELEGPSSLVDGDRSQLTVVVLDSAGGEIRDRPTEWNSSDTTVATVSDSGFTASVQAVSPGTVEITATVEGVTGTHRLVVSPPPVVEAPRVDPEPTVAEEEPAAAPGEPSPTLLDSIRTTVQEARERAGASDFPAAYELLDRSGTRIVVVLAQFPEAPSLGELYDWYIGEYRATMRDCELYVEAVTGLPGIVLPTCKPPPGGG